MNISWLIKNIKNSWQTTPSFSNFVNRLRWTYSKNQIRYSSSTEIEITFSYPPPLNEFKALLRANKGSDMFIFGEVFDHQYYHLGLPFTPATILDLGANAGLTAIYFSKMYPNAELALVEPMPDNLRILNRNLAINSVNATVIPAAVTVKDGPVYMEMGGKDYGHKVSENNTQLQAQTLKVDGLTISSMLQKLSWNRIGLLKMDIEGYERILFSTKCDWMNLVDAMCIECHDGFGLKELEQLAHEYRFSSPTLLPGIWLMTRK